jgi:hypothetical protein
VKQAERERPLVRPDEAAELLGLTHVAKNPRQVVLDMARRGQLVAVRVSKYVMIERASVERYVKGRRV